MNDQSLDGPLLSGSTESSWKQSAAERPIPSGTETLAPLLTLAYSSFMLCAGLERPHFELQISGQVANLCQARDLGPASRPREAQKHGQAYSTLASTNRVAALVRRITVGLGIRPGRGKG